MGAKPDGNAARAKSRAVIKNEVKANGISIVSAKPPADPLREALATAVQQSAEAKADVDRQRSAIERTRASVRTAEKAVEAAEENIGKAQEVYAEALAMPPPATGLPD